MSEPTHLYVVGVPYRGLDDEQAPECVALAILWPTVAGGLGVRYAVEPHQYTGYKRHVYKSRMGRVCRTRAGAWDGWIAWTASLLNGAQAKVVRLTAQLAAANLSREATTESDT